MTGKEREQVLEINQKELAAARSKKAQFMKDNFQGREFFRKVIVDMGRTKVKYIVKERFVKEDKKNPQNTQGFAKTRLFGVVKDGKLLWGRVPGDAEGVKDPERLPLI